MTNGIERLIFFPTLDILMGSLSLNIANFVCLISTFYFFILIGNNLKTKKKWNIQSSKDESCHHQTSPWLSRTPFEKKTFWTQMLQQTLSQKIESFRRKSLTPHVNLKGKTSITCKSFIMQAWNFTWNLQLSKNLKKSLQHLPLT
jgi:hypothetical protein